MRKRGFERGFGSRGEKQREKKGLREERGNQRGYRREGTKE